jgi:hypothetical protein
MRTRSFVMAFLLVLLPLGAYAQALDVPTKGNRPCTKCSDLCSLVDQYWQKERGIEVWKQYAASSFSGKATLPNGVTDIGSLYKQVYEKDLPNAWKKRTLPCRLAPEWEQPGPKAPMAPPDGTGLETKVFDGSCETVFGGKKLEGDNEKKWRDGHECKGSADAELAHEQVHQKICRDTWASDPSTARDQLAAPENLAESELQAWRRHRNRLRDEILQLAYQCGWEPTDRQKATPGSVPTEKQTKLMEAMGWNAFSALFDSSF